MIRSLSIFVAFGVCAISTSAAEIIYTSQNRYTQINFHSGQGSLEEKEESGNFGSFESRLSKRLGIGEASAFGSATQESHLTTASIVADGSVAGSTGPPVGTSGAGGKSHFETGFSIDELSQYQLAFSTSDTESGQVRLVGPSFDIDTPLGFLNGIGPVSIAENGFVQPGDYAFEVDIESGALTQGGTFDLLFQISLPGDFDFDGFLNLDDIDSLTSAVNVKSTDKKYDVNEDNVIDSQDRTTWVKELRGTSFGDSNLDGEFDSNDLIAALSTGEYEDGIVGNSLWAEGDWDGDGEFRNDDLIFALQEGGYNRSPRPTNVSVPEPTTNVQLVVFVFTLWFRRGKTSLERLLGL